MIASKAIFGSKTSTISVLRDVEPLNAGAVWSRMEMLRSKVEDEPHAEPGEAKVWYQHLSPYHNELRLLFFGQ